MYLRLVLNRVRASATVMLPFSRRCSTIRPVISRYLKIQVVNGLAIFFSLGLAIPWATVRKLKYLAECMFVTADKDQLDKVVQTAPASDTALGDAAVDYLDFDIG